MKKITEEEIENLGAIDFMIRSRELLEINQGSSEEKRSIILLISNLFLIKNINDRNIKRKEIVNKINNFLS